MPSAGWSSLPPDVVRLIAGCLLDTNDVNYYMDFRAVCPSWRSATDDPKDDPTGLRFRPRRWIIIDELFQNDSRLLVNTATGRVVRKELPLLNRYFFIATTHGGFFVLANKEPPHAALVLNPFTGHIIRYKAPVTPWMRDAAAAVSASSPAPTLVFVFGRRCVQCAASPDSDCFPDVDKENDDLFTLRRMLNELATGNISADGAALAMLPDDVLCWS